jgi:hypothetical protein
VNGVGTGGSGGVDPQIGLTVMFRHEKGDQAQRQNSRGDKQSEFTNCVCVFRAFLAYPGRPAEPSGEQERRRKKSNLRPQPERAFLGLRQLSFAGAALEHICLLMM